SATTTVKISNLEPRFDEYHLQIDAHDGNIKQWEEGGLYYLYGMGYQNCTIEHGTIPPQECPGIYKDFGSCGFRSDHALRVYTSFDLSTWSLVYENAFPEESRPSGIYFRPKVIYNAATSQYLLWINHLADAANPLLAYPDAAYVVASSPAPQGPFTVINERAAISQSGAGDFDILVDPNDASRAYIAYDAWGNDHRVIVEELNSDFTDASTNTEPSDFLTPTGNEAPIFFERKGWYYILYGPTCCFCKEGSGAEVLVSSSPLGPWTSMDTDLNPRLPDSLYRTIAGQNSFIFQVASADGGMTVIFASDRWSSASDGLKSHDFQYWQPLSFDDSVSPPTIAPLVWQDWFLLEV
ncbi:unnamed protein product, partial [Ectocarpus fasciculatus]